MDRVARFWITNSGREHIAGLGAGEDLIIHEITVGTGNIYDSSIDPREITGLISPIIPKSTMTRTNPVRNGTNIHFTAQYRSDLNRDTDTFVLREFAGLLVDGTVIFYGTLGDNGYDAIKHDDSGDEFNQPPFSGYIVIDLAEGVGLTFNFPADAWVTHDEIQEIFNHIGDRVSQKEVHGLKFERDGEDWTIFIDGEPIEIGGRGIIVPPYTEPQIPVSDLLDPENPRYLPRTINADAKPVRNFRSENSLRRFWHKTVPPYPSDLVAKISFDNGFLVPEVGNFTLTQQGTTPVTGYWDDVNGARRGSATAQIVANQRIVPIGARSYRLKVRIPPGTPSNAGVLLGEQNHSVVDFGENIHMRADGGIAMQLRNGSPGGVTQAASINSIVNVSDGEWHEVLFTWTGTTATNGLRCWIDGVLTSEVTMPFVRTAQTTTTTHFFSTSLLLDNNTFRGEIDDIEIYNTVRTPDSFSSEMLGGLLLTWDKSDVLFPQKIIIRMGENDFPTDISEGVLVAEIEGTSHFIEGGTFPNLTEYMTAFARNFRSTSRGVNVNDPLELTQPSESVTGMIAGLGSVILEFPPRVLTLSMVGGTHGGAAGSNRPHPVVIIDGAVGHTRESQFFGANATAETVTSRIDARGFTIVARSSTANPIFYEAER